MCYEDSNKAFYERDENMIRALGSALKDAGGGTAVMQWSAGSFNARVAISSTKDGDTLRFEGPAELAEFTRRPR